MGEHMGAQRLRALLRVEDLRAEPVGDHGQIRRCRFAEVVEVADLGTMIRTGPATPVILGGELWGDTDLLGDIGDNLRGNVVEAAWKPPFQGKGLEHDAKAKAG